jgi:hypothetical protein
MAPAGQGVAQAISGTLALLSIPNDRCYRLSDIGGRAWGLCAGTRTVAKIIEVIQQEYEAPVDRVQDNLIRLLHALAEEHLVDAHDQVRQAVNGRGGPGRLLFINGFPPCTRQQ